MSNKPTLADIRTLGRRLMDLTGNGPPTRSERIRSALRLAPPHPKYHISGPTFLSLCPNEESLSASLVYRPGRLTACDSKVCIQTVTYTEPDEDGFDSDITAFIDTDLLFKTPSDRWGSLGANEAASRLAKIGRHLVWAKTTEIYATPSASTAITLCDDTEGIIPLIHLLQFLLACNGLSEPDQYFSFRAPSPILPAELILHGTHLQTPQRVGTTFAALASPQLRIANWNQELHVESVAFNVDLAHKSTLDILAISRRALDIFESLGWSEDDYILKDPNEPQSATRA